MQLFHNNTWAGIYREQLTESPYNIVPLVWGEEEIWQMDWDQMKTDFSTTRKQWTVKDMETIGKNTNSMS